MPQGSPSPTSPHGGASRDRADTGGTDRLNDRYGDRHADRHTDHHERNTDRLTDRHTDHHERNTDRHNDRHSERHTERLSDRMTEAPGSGIQLLPNVKHVPAHLLGKSGEQLVYIDSKMGAFIL